MLGLGGGFEDDGHTAARSEVNGQLRVGIDKLFIDFAGEGIGFPIRIIRVAEDLRLVAPTLREERKRKDGITALFVG